LHFCADRIAFGRVYFCVSSNQSTPAQVPPPPAFLYSCSSKVYKKRKEKTSNLEKNQTVAGEDEESEEGEESERGGKKDHHHHHHHHKNRKERTVIHLKGEWVEIPEGETKYDPLELDDPRLQKGKHRTVLALPSCRISLLPYVKKKDLKEDLNEQFEARHPQIYQDIKLTTIRNAKKRMLEYGIMEALELQTISTAVIIYEKVILRKKIISKENKKAIAACCLLMGIKFVDDRATSKTFLNPILEGISKQFSVSKESILDEEMTVLKAINFGVFVDPKNVIHHTQRLENTLDSLFTDIQIEKYKSQCKPTQTFIPREPNSLSY